MDGLLWLLIVLVFFVFWELKSSNKNLCRILLMTDKEKSAAREHYKLPDLRE